MLNLNNGADAASIPSFAAEPSGSFSVEPKEPVWKVLIYDQESQDIISPILKVNGLREQGITIHIH
ncbi:hypothetical protein BC829DRAFT_152960 [Chytridium lagenaria]|nr:hypothetical protein BC829DRAFT_152960 [Chytridium lagenaria]